MSRLVNGQQQIENRRRSENAYREMDAVTAVHQQIQLRTNFEIATTNKIERKAKQQMFELKKKEYVEKLNERRKKLANLYNFEMDSWKQEILSRVETIEDRKRRIMEKAYALRDAREKSRKEFVDKCLNDQWRDSCDDARTLDSQAMVKFMNKERLAQIREKVERKQALSRQENNFLSEWNRQLDELERRDREKEEYRRRIDRETSQALRKQIDDNERLKESYYQNMRREEDEELLRLRQEIEADEQNQIRKRQEAHERGREVMKYNLDNQSMRMEEAEIEREHDAILLNYALQKEKEALKAEEAKRNADRNAAIQYRKYLEEQMVKEAEDTAFVDEVRRQEEERVWKARDDALKAREDARAYLMRTVDEGRQEQIRYKREEMLREKLDDNRFVSKFMDEAAEAVNKAREDEQRRRRINIESCDELKKQIEKKALQEEFLKQEEYLSNKQMKYREKLHQQRLAEQAGSIRMNFPLQKNQWFT